PRTRRLPRDRGCHARTAAPRSRSSEDLLSVDCGHGPTETPVAMTVAELHNPLLLLLAGLAIDAAFGDMPAVFAHIPHPVVLAGRAIAFFEAKLNRPTRSERRRRERGIVTVLLLVAVAAALGWGLHRLCRGSLLGP